MNAGKTLERFKAWNRSPVELKPRLPEESASWLALVSKKCNEALSEGVRKTAHCTQLLLQEGTAATRVKKHF